MLCYVMLSCCLTESKMDQMMHKTLSPLNNMRTKIWYKMVTFCKF